jgi:FMN-dependent NADH-azoreductase
VIGVDILDVKDLLYNVNTSAEIHHLVDHACVSGKRFVY